MLLLFYLIRKLRLRELMYLGRAGQPNNIASVLCVLLCACIQVYGDLVHPCEVNQSPEAGHVPKWVERLPGICKALGSIPNTL